MILAFTLVVPACRSASSTSVSMDPGQFDHDMVVRWTERVVAVIEQNGYSPLAAGRVLAYTSLAMRQALAAAPTVEALGGIEGLPAPSDVTEPVHWPTVVGAAAAQASSRLFVGSDTAAALEQELERDTAGYAAEVDGDTLARSRRQGEQTADLIVDWAETDGYDEASDAVHVPAGAPGSWEPTPPAFAIGLEPAWGTLRLFVAGSEGCAPEPPEAYSFRIGSPFHEQALSVYETGQSLSDEQREIARFWNMEPNTGTPAGHWTRIAATVIEDSSLSLLQAAETQAAMAVAIADAFVVGWKAKYDTDVLRPVTYIRAHIDQDWLPYLVTPQFPEYPSGHSVSSGAAAQVLTAMLGEVRFTDDSNHDGTERTFESFAAAALEAAESRLYGGVHYPMGIEQGNQTGRCVGEQVAAGLALEAAA